MYLPPAPQDYESERRATDRDIYQLARINMQTIVLTARRLSQPGRRVSSVNSNESVKTSYVTGRAVTSYEDRRDVIYNRNITLKDTNGRVLLQRFGPADRTAYYAMRRKAADGSQRLFAMTNSAVPTGPPSDSTRQNLEDSTAAQAAANTDLSPEAEEQRRSAFNRLHLGAWYDQRNQRLLITQDTEQRKHPEGKSAVGAMCAWVKEYVQAYVAPLLGSESGLCEQFREELQTRIADDFPWAEKRVPGLAHYCHPLYSTFLAFRGFSGGAHRDVRDKGVSILLNFGQHAVFELPTYRCRLELQPLDIVLFRSDEILHRSYQHESYRGTDVMHRFAVTCFMRKGIVDRLEPAIQHVFRYLHSDSPHDSGQQVVAATRTSTEAGTSQSRRSVRARTARNMSSS